MSVHLLKALEELSADLENLGRQIERQVLQSVHALITRDMLLAKRVARRNQTLAVQREKLEENCLHTLALYQPVALDLRFIVAVAKVTKDLETVAECAATIAKHALRVAQRAERSELIETRILSEEVCVMLADALTALIRRDDLIAEELYQREAEIIGRHRDNQRRIEDAILREPQRARAFLQLLTISACLKEVGLRAAAIGRDTQYVVKGRQTPTDSQINS